MSSATPLLSLRAVRKSYTLGGATIAALRGIDLDLARGEIAAITGPSGSGKSTLLNLCGLLDHADSGAVRYDGATIATNNEAERTALRRQTIGFVFQSFNLVPVMSAHDNVDFPLHLLGIASAERRRRVAAALDAVGLSALAQHRPDQLSGGQRQRVAIARAIVKNPRLVIADEPSANLDAVTAAQIVALMRQLAHQQGTTFLVATHDDRLLASCDRSFNLDDGVLAGAHHAH